MTVGGGCSGSAVDESVVGISSRAATLADGKMSQEVITSVQTPPTSNRILERYDMGRLMIVYLFQLRLVFGVRGGERLPATLRGLC